MSTRLVINRLAAQFAHSLVADHSWQVALVVLVRVVLQVVFLQR